MEWYTDEKDKISVEHIYPQSGDNAYWLKRFGKYTDDSIHNITNSIGNLLPLSMAINSSFQNDSFLDKDVYSFEEMDYIKNIIKQSFDKTI